MELVGSVSGKVRALKKPGGGKKTNSVFEGFFVPMCILSPNQVKWSERKVINFLVSVMDSNKNEPSST